MVRKNKAKKYNKRMGQNTGTSKILKRERKMEIDTALAAESLAAKKKEGGVEEEHTSVRPNTNNRPKHRPKHRPRQSSPTARTLTKT